MRGLEHSSASSLPSPPSHRALEKKPQQRNGPPAVCEQLSDMAERLRLPPRGVLAAEALLGAAFASGLLLGLLLWCVCSCCCRKKRRRTIFGGHQFRYQYADVTSPGVHEAVA